MNIAEPIVLIIDDELEYASSMVKRLGRRGIRSESAGTAMHGISLAMEKRFSVCVLDVNLPGMNGIAALKILKSCRPDLAIILLTGHASASVGEEGLEAGAVEYLLKPVEFECLLEKLHAVHASTHKASGHGFSDTGHHIED